MSNNDNTRQDAPTRRDYVKYGGAVIGGGLLAGCTDGMSPGTGATDTTPSATDTPTDDSYSVTTSPVGTVEFEAVPETAYGYSPQYADMAVAVGHGDTIASLGFPENYGVSLGYYYDSLDGVTFDAASLTQVYNDGVDKELFYEIDADVHFQDPCWLTSFSDGWTESDIEEVRENVGPFFGNRYSRENTKPPEGCRDGYRYYDLWELSGKVASVYRERERFAALEAEYEKLYGNLRTTLPPKSERPRVGLVVFSEEKFFPYEINSPGFGKAHTRPLGARDAFADSDRTYDQNYDAKYDYEGMLEIDPDVILHNFGVGGFYDTADIRETWESHPVGKELTAVQNDRVYSSGTAFQGPLMNLFQLEMTAKQLYPEQFGEWPGDGSEEAYPDIPADEQLFDHGRVTDIVNGEI